MKKIFLSIAAIAIYGYSFSQISILPNGNIGLGTETPTQKVQLVGNTYLNGNLGVGIATPAQKLHVVGNTFLNGNLGVGIETPTQKLHVVGNTFLNGNLGVGIETPAQKLHVVGNTYLNGNLGVGIATPTQKLHVNGNAFISDSLDVKGVSYFGKGYLSFPVIIGKYMYAGGPPNVYAPVIYGELPNTLNIGKSDNRISNIWTYAIYYQNIYQTSDMRLKENIKPCTSLLSKLKEVKAYNYNYTDAYFKDFSPEQKQKAKKTEYGFLAQELQKVFPELVKENDEDGVLSVNYVSMIPILTSAINELQQKVESLEKALTTCCNANQTKSMQTDENGNMQEFNLTDPASPNTDEMRLYQNAPNPFNTTTTIQCYIPQTMQKAELCVYNMQGAQIKCLTVSERGNVNVQIQAGQLSAGVYTYLLIGDGKTSETKQMILTK